MSLFYLYPGSGVVLDCIDSLSLPFSYFNDHVISFLPRDFILVSQKIKLHAMRIKQIKLFSICLAKKKYYSFSLSFSTSLHYGVLAQ